MLHPRSRSLSLIHTIYMQHTNQFWNTHSNGNVHSLSVCKHIPILRTRRRNIQIHLCTSIAHFASPIHTATCHLPLVFFGSLDGFVLYICCVGIFVGSYGSTIKTAALLYICNINAKGIYLSVRLQYECEPSKIQTVRLVINLRYIYLVWPLSELFAR